MGSEWNPRRARRAEVPDAGDAHQPGGDEGVAAVDEPAPPPDRDRVFDEHAARVLIVTVVRDAGAEQVGGDTVEKLMPSARRGSKQVKIADEEAIEVRRVARRWRRASR